MQHNVKTGAMIGEGTDYNFQRALQVLTTFTEDDIGIGLHNNSQRQERSKQNNKTKRW